MEVLREFYPSEGKGRLAEAFLSGPSAIGWPERVVARGRPRGVGGGGGGGRIAKAASASV